MNDNVCKLKKILDIVGLEKFLKIVDAIDGTVYIPKKSALIREMIVKDSNLFFEELNKTSTTKEAAEKFNVCSKTINNWKHLAMSCRHSPKSKRWGSDADKLARSLL